MIPPERTPTFGSELKKEIQDVVEAILPDAVAAFLLVALIAGVEKALEWSIGDYKFFGLLPVRWVFDASHLTIILYFLLNSIWRSIRRFR
jgi:hypothetical protein